MTTEKVWHVYRVVGPIGGPEKSRSYIGCTHQNLNARWRQHVRDARMGKGARALGAAIRQHGREAFKLEVLCAVEGKTAAFAMERKLILGHGTMEPAGYNRKIGNEHTPLGRARMRAARSGLCAGEQNPGAKMTIQQATWAKDQWARGWSAKKVAAALGVTKWAIGRLVRGETWKCLEA